MGLMHDNWNARIRCGRRGAHRSCRPRVRLHDSPTYGTDKTANAQLMSDLSNITSFNDKKRAPIDYSPRPDLSEADEGNRNGDRGCAAPQDPITTTAATPSGRDRRSSAWRIRADAAADQDSRTVARGRERHRRQDQQQRKKKMGQAWRSFE